MNPATLHVAHAHRLLRAATLVSLASCATVGRTASDGDAPAALLHRAIAYAGGEEALARARALQWNGEAVVHAGGRDVAIAGLWSVLPPDTAVVSTWAVAAGPASTRDLVLAAPRGWTVSKGAFTPMTPAMLANERDAFYLYEVLRLVPLRSPEVRVIPIAADSVGRRGFGVRRDGRPAVDVYVDGDGRLAWLRTTVAHPVSGAPARQDLIFEGTLSASGIRWPRTLRIVLDGAPYFDLTMRELRVLSRLDSPLLLGPR